MVRTGIIGGGASGLMAAIRAAGSGADVTVIEKRNRAGKKILMTGNGRCNLSNRDFCVDRDYRSSDIGLLNRYFDQFGVEDTIAFFQSAGMLTTEKNGYLYPRSLQAATVLDVLREEADRRKVRTVCECEVKAIRKSKAGFTVKTSQGDFIFDTLVLACGSQAGTNAKEGLGGWQLARDLGLTVNEVLPALTGLRCGERFCKSLAGVRCAAGITLTIVQRGQKRSYQESGELQLTDYGISGIPVFQLSRYAAAALQEKDRVEASINFFPEIEEKDWKAFCDAQYQRCKGYSVGRLAEGLLHKKVAQTLLAECRIRADETVGACNGERLEKLFAKMRSLPLTVKAVNTMESAQVCMGGVALREMDENLQVKRLPSLFVCGEMLDVDGRCGGYNLQWAWTSGFIAGRAAAAGGNERTDRRKR